jgi:hypothetical protein
MPPFILERQSHDVDDLTMKDLVLNPKGDQALHGKNKPSVRDEQSEPTPQVIAIPVVDPEPGPQAEPAAQPEQYITPKVEPKPKMELLHELSEEDEDEFSETEKYDSSDEGLGDDQRRQRKKMLIEAEKRFTRKCGIIYVSDDYWLKTLISAVNCHLFVSSTVADKPILKGTEKPMSKGTGLRNPNSRTRSPSPSSNEPILNAAGDMGAAKATLTHALPFRIRIVNELLNEEMRRICGLAELNHDHMAPFRSIIPFEKEFRHLHKQKEDEFVDIANGFPDHPAVRRKRHFLPTSLAYHVKGMERTNPKDDIDRARILLDGLRALVYFLDTDLRDLVETVQRLKAGRVDKIPFSYLWYLFSPGQEIVTRHPKHQVYRVLQVTGGRKSLTARAGSKVPFQRTISDLVIDCFYLDFDGKQYGTKPFTISIRPYDDLMPVTDLLTYPLVYDKEMSEADLINRGKKFAELGKVSHRRYKGLSLREDDRFDRLEEVRCPLARHAAYRTLLTQLKHFSDRSTATS